MQPAVVLDLTARGSLIEDLDNRQDEILAQLDDLNSRLEQVLSAWTAKPTLADAA